MYKLNIIAVCLLIVLFSACSKDEDRVFLSEGSVSFEQPPGKDTLQMPVSLLRDTTVIISLKAALSGAASAEDHWVSFAADTTKILEYRSKYGNALLLPASSYLFFKSTARIPAGNSVSESAELNIVQQTKLTEYSTYVLPLVVKTVDGKEDLASERVLFLVLKTGKPLTINRTGWTIAGQSSVQGTFVAANLIDANNFATYWASNIQQQMPQWVSISFNRDITFTGVTYYVPTLLRYPTLGGYPTSIRIETSMNGTQWVDKGVFAGDVKDNMQTLDIGLTTARYLRFTSLSAVRYSSLYDAVFIGGVSLVP